MRPHLADSFPTRCLRGLLLAVQFAVSGGLTIAHAGDAAAFGTEVRIEDPSSPSSAPVHDEAQCLTCRTLASAAQLAAQHPPIQLQSSGSAGSPLSATETERVSRTFSAPLAARPPPRA